MDKPTIILATSNGIGMGHLTRASAIASELKSFANPIIISMAAGVVEVPKIAGVRFEYIPGRDRKWMGRLEWDAYLRDRIVALIDETNAKIVSFDGVVPYPGIIGVKSVRPNVNLVWVRRGFWQKTRTRYLLNLQSSMMDLIITPGDFGQSYDKGPTAVRKDSVLVKPIQDQIFTIVQDVAEQRKFDFIFDKSSDLTMLFAAKRFDVSDQVLRIITRTDKREQLTKKQLAIEEEKENKEEKQDKYVRTNLK